MWLQSSTYANQTLCCRYVGEREHTDIRLWWQATPTGVLLMHHQAYIRARWHTYLRNHKTKNNYYVDFNTPTMQMLGVVFRFLRTKGVYFQCIIQVELSRTANHNNLDTNDLWVSSTASVLNIKEWRKTWLRQWSMQKKHTAKTKWKREKAKVREGLGHFLIKSEAERDVEYELQHPLYCSSHMRWGGKDYILLLTGCLISQHDKLPTECKIAPSFFC